MTTSKNTRMARKVLLCVTATILLAASLMCCMACDDRENNPLLGKWQVQNTKIEMYFTIYEDTIVTDAGTMHYSFSESNKLELSTDSGSKGTTTYELSDDNKTLVLTQANEDGKIESTTLKKVANLPKENTSNSN